MSLSHRRHLVLLFETQTMKSKNFKADENWLPWSNPSQSHPSTLAPRCYIHLRRCYAPCVNRCHSLSQDREKVMKAWLLSVVDQAPEADEAGGDLSNSSSSTEKRKKQLEKKALETEELPFLLQSGVLLCRLLKFKNLDEMLSSEGLSTSSNLPVASLALNFPPGLSLPREATSGHWFSK